MLKRPLFALAVLLFALPALAQDDEKQEEPKKNPDVEKYEAAIKDAKKYEGAFTIYTKKDEILLELPEDKLDRLFFVQPTLHTGFAALLGQAGEPLSDGPIDVFKFKRTEDKVLLVRPNTRYRWNEGDPLALASQRTFPEAIVANFSVEQKHPEKKLLLIDVGQLFQGTVFDLAQFVNVSAGGAAMLDRELTTVDTIRALPDATIVRMNVHFRSQGGGGEMDELMALLGLGSPNHLEDQKSIPFKVTYTLWYRKDSDYVPRVADTRIGYFTQDYFNVSRFNLDDRTERYIARFNVKKRNPFAPVSDAAEPLVWYIDPSVPKKFRPGVRAGILAWNKAFEKAGITNAIEVRDAPENDPNWDHADGRHNLVRWNMSEDAAYAVAWFRIDPISGEVLSAAVSVDANYASAMLQEYEFTLRQGRLADLSAKALLRPAEGEPDPLQTLVTGKEPKSGRLLDVLKARGWNNGHCEYASELASSAAMGWAALVANGSKVTEDDFMQQFVADLVMHEVGHCLGLRHNFAGSTQWRLSEMTNDAKVRERGLSASVMDYTPVNTAAVLRGEGVFFNVAPGPYDLWAIEYGYTQFNAKSPADETSHLAAIAKRSGEPGHIFLTDEDADGLNPLAVRFDLGSDTIEWIKADIAGNDSVRKYAIEKLTKDGESYDLRTRLVLGSYMRSMQSVMMATRFVGGVEMRRIHKGDVNERPTLVPVDPKIQRQAMKMIIDQVLMKETVELPDNVMFNLTMDPNEGTGGFWNAPLRSIVGGNQIAVLSALMSGSKLDRILENDFKLERAKDRYTIAEHYNWLFAAVFKEVGQNKNITTMRRDLQRYMVEGLILQAGAPSRAIADDARVVASQGLARLKARFDKQIAASKGLDELTLLHLKDVSQRIARFQNRVVTGR